MPYSDFSRIPDLNQMLRITAFVIIGFIIIAVLYTIAYKIHINRVLKKGREGVKIRHAAFLTPGTVLVVIGVMLVIAGYISLVNMINANYLLTDSVAYCNDVICRTQNELQQEYHSSLITDNYSFEVGSKHPETKTVDLTLTLSSNLVLGKNDRLTFRIGDSKTELKPKKNQPGYYTGTVQVDGFQGEPAGVLMLEADGQKISQILKNAPIYGKDDLDEYDGVTGDEWRSFYPNIDVSVNTDKATAEKDGKIHLEQMIEVNSYTAEYDPKNEFTEMKLVIKEGNKTLREVDLMKNKTVMSDEEEKEFGVYQYLLNETVNEDVVLDYYVFAKTSVGYSYECYFHAEQMSLGDDGELVGEHQTIFSDIFYCSIYDKNGDLFKTVAKG